MHFPPAETAPHLRFMHPPDIPQLVQIEQHAVPCPWPADAFHDCLHAEEVCCWVLEREAVIEAYGIVLTEARHAHILNVCVRPGSRGRGIGRLLLTNLVEQLHQQHIDTIMLEVRLSNTVAVHLYTSLGFKAIGLRQAFYHTDHGDEDALIMVRYM